MNSFAESSGAVLSPSTKDQDPVSTPANHVSESTLVSSPDAPSNHGNKLTLQLPNGTDFEGSHSHSASDLLKTIIIASQASPGSQLATNSSMNTISTKMDHLPADLQNFKADPFTVEINGTNGHMIQQQQQQQQIQQLQQHIQQQQQIQQHQLHQQLQHQQQQHFQQQLHTTTNNIQIHSSEVSDITNNGHNINSAQVSPTSYVVQQSSNEEMGGNSQLFTHSGGQTSSMMECLTSPLSSNQDDGDHGAQVKSENVLMDESGVFTRASSIPSFEGIAQLNAQEGKEFEKDNPSILETILTRDNGMDTSFHTSPTSNKSLSSPEQFHHSPQSSANSPTYREHPAVSMMDTNHDTTTTYTEMHAPVPYSEATNSASLITKSEKLSINTLHTLAQEEELKKLFEWNVTKIDDSELEHIEVSRHAKIQKMSYNSLDSNSVLSPSVEKVFDADIGPGMEFKFSKFGQSEPFQFGSEELQSKHAAMEIEKPLPVQNLPKLPIEKDPSPVREEASPFHAPQPPSNLMSRKRDQVRRSKEPILCQHFPSKISGYELRILQQPEEQHRARYLTEGSRGSVKNRTGQGYPVVKLFGSCKEATLQVFIGCDVGRVRPHGFYQACKVSGKNSTQCVEKDIDGTTVIEIEMKSEYDMTAAIDCVGILKLRNADVEQRIGIVKAKKKSTKARMIFRVTFQKPCGNPQVLQVASGPILCTQPVGHPEICKMSMRESPVSGGGELFIIGKNFLRGTRVFFQQIKFENEIAWEAEGEIDTDFFQATHLIVGVPEYNLTLGPDSDVTCQVVVHSGGKISDPQAFVYKSEDCKVKVKQEIPMDTVEESRKRNYPFVAPEALELNQQIQQSQGSQSQGSKERFQLPPGIINGTMAKKTAIFLEDASPAGIGFTSPQTPVEANPFSPEQERETMAGEGFSLTQSKFGADSLTPTPTVTWVNNPLDTSQQNCDSETVHISDHGDGIIDNNNLLTQPQSVLSESYSEDDAYNTFSSDTLSSLSNCSLAQSRTSVVDQFLENVALMKSDPMLSSAPRSYNNTVLTQSNNKVVLSIGGSKKIFNAPTYSSGERSLLKEALTCPPASLASLNFGAPHCNSSQVVPSSPCTEVEMTEMEGAADTPLYTNETINVHEKSIGLHQTDNSGSLQGLSLRRTSVAMDTSSSIYMDQESASQKQLPHSPYVPEPYNGASLPSTPGMQSGSMSGPPSVQENNPLSPQVTDPALPSSASVAHDNQNYMQQFITVPVSIAAAAGVTATSSINNLNSQFNQTQPVIFSNTSAALTASQLNPTSISNAFNLVLPSSGSNQSGTIFSQLARPSLQISQPAFVATPVLSVSMTPQFSTTSDQGRSPSLSQNLQQALENLQQQQQQKHQQQQQLNMLLQHLNQQTQHTQQPVLSNLSMTHQSHQNPSSMLTQATPASSVTPSTIIATPRSIAAPTKQLGTHTSAPVLSALQSYLAGQGVLSQSAASADIVSNTPPATTLSTITQAPVPSPSISNNANGGQGEGPRIIICNNSEGQGQAQSQFSGPSIVIMPGAGGPNNQMESLLRSILGSMMPQQQQQQQQQQGQNLQPQSSAQQ